MLEEVLAAVDPPELNHARGQLVRCSTETPCRLVGYYAINDLQPIPTLARLRAIIDQSPAAELTGQRRDQLIIAFKDIAQSLAALRSEAETARRKASESALAEEVRQLLLEGVYIELALSAAQGLFDQEGPLEFTEEAYQRLKRHKVPFAGALRVVGADLPTPRQDDPRYLRLRECKPDVLKRQFETLRLRLTGRLQQLMALVGNRNSPVEEGASRPSPITVADLSVCAPGQGA